MFTHRIVENIHHRGGYLPISTLKKKIGCFWNPFQNKHSIINPSWLFLNDIDQLSLDSSPKFDCALGKSFSSQGDITVVGIGYIANTHILQPLFANIYCFATEARLSLSRLMVLSIFPPLLVRPSLPTPSPPPSPT